MSESKFSEPTRRWLESGRHLTIEGKRIFVYERGDGPPVLLLHGFPTSGYDWRGVIDGLADAYRCAALDFPGYGLSDKPEAYSYSLFQQTDIVEGLVKALAIEQAHLVSHDVGTSVHTELLAREGEGRLPFHILSSTFLNGSMLQDMATITPFQKLLASNETLPQAMAISGNLTANYIEGLKSVMKRPECLTVDDVAVMNDLIAYQDGNRRLPALSLYMRERYIHRGRWIGALKQASPSIDEYEEDLARYQSAISGAEAEEAWHAVEAADDDVDQAETIRNALVIGAIGVHALGVAQAVFKYPWHDGEAQVSLSPRLDALTRDTVRVSLVSLATR